jgi:hypothetical protein
MLLMPKPKSVIDLAMLTDERDRLRATAKTERADHGRKKCWNNEYALHGLNIIL